MTLRTTDLVAKGKRVALLGAALASGLTATPAFAVTADGSLGATSTGTVDITASVPARARITGLVDVTFPNQDPAVAASFARNVCIWSNTATKGYTIRATGDGAANAFTIRNGVLTPVPYSVQWAATSGQTSGTALTTGTASATLTTTAVNQTCSAAPTSTASLIIGIATTDLSTMTAGINYTGTLTLLVTPQ